MKKIDLLDKAKLLTGSDGETARIIGMPKQHISNVRHGLRQLTPYQSAKLAELIGERWHDAALERLAELAASEEERQFWRGKVQMLAGIARAGALAVFLIIGGVFLPQTGNAVASNLSPEFHQADYLLCTYSVSG